MPETGAEIVFRRLNKTLTCPACGTVIAAASYRPWRGDLTVTSVDGTPLQPLSGAVQLRLAQMRLDEASTVGERAAGQARLDFVRRNLSELLYEFRCREGHSTLCSMPQLASAMRAARGEWVRVGPRGR
jgi:hypothetical protein